MPRPGHDGRPRHPLRGTPTATVAEKRRRGLDGGGVFEAPPPVWVPAPGRTRRRLDPDLRDDLTVFGLTDRGEADALEEGLRPTRTRLVDDVDVAHAAVARLIDELRDGEAADTAALIVGVDVDAPQRRTEVVLRRLEIEVRAHESHDVVAVEHDALPRRGGIGDGAGDGIG